MYWAHWAYIPIVLGLGLKIVTLQLAPFVGIACVLVSLTIMMGSGPHQTSPHQAKLANVRQQDELYNLEHQRDREDHQEGSMHDVHTDGVVFEGKVM